MDERLKNIERKLDDQDSKLDTIKDTIAQIAVQNERINNLESKNAALWRMMDTLSAPNGILSNIQMHQASCPRSQMKYLWGIVLPMALTQLMVAFAVIGLFWKG